MAPAPRVGEGQAACNTPGGGGKGAFWFLPHPGAGTTGTGTSTGTLSHQSSLARWVVLWVGVGRDKPRLTEGKPDCSGLTMD